MTAAEQAHCIRFAEVIDARAWLRPRRRRLVRGGLENETTWKRYAARARDEDPPRVF
jgi:hypothetical protein